MPEDLAPYEDCIRTAELLGALSLATDLGLALPLEYGLRSALVAARLSAGLALDAETTAQAYYLSLLFYVGCTADAEIAAALFPDEEGMARHFSPVMLGSRREMFVGLVRALGSDHSTAAGQLVGGAVRLPAAARGHRPHMRAICEVATMLTDRLGLPASMSAPFAHLTERWDGKGEPEGLKGEEVPLGVRVAHVARDAIFQSGLGGASRARKVVGSRAGAALDPAVVSAFVEDVDAMVAFEPGSLWDEVLAAEPEPVLTLRGGQLDRALAAVGDFADLSAPCLVGHSTGVADLTEAAAARCGLDASVVLDARRAAYLQDLGRIAVPMRAWHKPGPLTADDWERVRLHPYQTERILARSPYLARLGALGAGHHERLDGSGYHRGATAATIPPAARVLAAADAYQAMTEPRPHRDALTPADAAATLEAEGKAGHLDPEAVAAVLEAAGHAPRKVERPAGLTERETEVVALLARGLQTKQIATRLAISPKTADRHIQNAYAKIGVSTRAAAAVFAMEHGLVRWAENAPKLRS